MPLQNSMYANPTSLLKDTLQETLPLAIAVSSEKARSEGIILPVLLEVKGCKPLNLLMERKKYLKR